MFMEKVKEELASTQKQLDAAEKQDDPNLAVWVPAKSYIDQVNFLLDEIQKQKDIAEQWELQFYRQRYDSE